MPVQKKSTYFQQGYGGIEMFLCAAVIGLIMYFYFYPTTFNEIPPQNNEKGGTYCRPVLDPDAPIMTIPSSGKQYRPIKEGVPIVKVYYDTTVGENHFGSFEKYQDPKDGKKYMIRDLTSGAIGRSYYFSSDLDPTLPFDLNFNEYGVIALFPTDENYNPLATDLKIGFSEGSNLPLILADFYQEVGAKALPPWVMHCQDFPTDPTFEERALSLQSPGASIPLTQGDFYYPNASGSAFKAEEQLNWFLFNQKKFLAHVWWMPHCKPAIYLYPEQDTKVNVQVAIPDGSFLYTDPIYPKEGPARQSPDGSSRMAGGWNVLAKPNGDLQYLGKDWADSKGKINYPDALFPYLYYEAKIADSAIEKPTRGFVIAYDQLENFYNDTLPKLGLNEKESQEFKEYWLKALPKSPYYFIGIVSQKNLDEIEPLTITPKQDTTIRVSLYFEALEDFKIVTPPQITTPTRRGFTVVEWGGMLKRDKDHPFTCVE